MVEIGPVVLEMKMKIRKVYRRTTGDQKSSRAFCLGELRGCHCIVSHYSCVIKDSEKKHLCIQKTNMVLLLKLEHQLGFLLYFWYASTLWTRTRGAWFWTGISFRSFCYDWNSLSRSLFPWGLMFDIINCPRT